MAKLRYPMTESDFFVMAECSIHSGDIDPVYPVMKRWFDNYQVSDVDRLWGCLLYLYLYNLPWTLDIFESYPSIEIAKANKIWEDSRLSLVKIGSDRRGIYWSGGLSLALKNLMDSLYNLNDLAYLPKDYKKVNEFIRSLPLGGVWSGFKYSDLVTQTTENFHLECEDLFLRERLAGPGEAVLALLGQDTKNHKYIKDNYPLIEAKLNEWVRIIGTKVNGYKTWSSKIFRFGLFELETVLCNYHSICTGSYYLGMDLDDMYIKLKDKLIKQGKSTGSDRAIAYLRNALFEEKNLIEFSGRKGREDIKDYRIKCYQCKPADILSNPKSDWFTEMCGSSSASSRSSSCSSHSVPSNNPKGYGTSWSSNGVII